MYFAQQERRSCGEKTLSPVMCYSEYAEEAGGGHTRMQESQRQTDRWVVYLEHPGVDRHHLTIQ